MSDAGSRDALAARGTRSGVLTLDELQTRHIDYVLALVEGNRPRAAELLGLSLRTLYRYAKVRTHERAGPYPPAASVGYVAPRTRLAWQYDEARVTAEAGDGWTAVVRQGLGGMFTAGLHHTNGSEVRCPPLRSVAEAQAWAQRVYESTALAALADHAHAPVRSLEADGDAQ